MKKIIFTVLFMFVFALAVSAVSMDIEVRDSNGNSYFPDSEGMFYLPSHISKTDVKFFFSDGDGVEICLPDDTLKSINSGEGVDITSVASTGLNNAYYNIEFKQGRRTYSFYMYFADSLPSVYVKTSNGADSLVKNGVKDENVKVSVINKNGKYEYRDTSGTNSEINVRGNTTTDYAKIPFKIKLYTKESLFGIGKGKSWVLLANYLDRSLIRNNVMYYLADKMGMMSPEFQSVDLYIDGNYYGIYLLCEKVQIGSGRVDIFDLEKETDKLNGTYNSYPTTVTTGELIDSTILTEYRYIDGVTDPADITGGYLIELDNSYYKGEKCYFVTSNNNHYVIKSPENASKKQVEYIAELFARMEEAIYSDNGYNSLGKYYTEYADLDSFAVAYIMSEYSRNYDAGSSSMYFYKDRDIDGVYSKVYKGPLWDCDNTLGNILKGGAAEQEGFWARDRRLWSGLTKHEDFNLKVKEKFEIMYDIVYDMADAGGNIDSWISELGNSLVMEQVRNRTTNYKTWPLYKDGTHYDRWQPSQTFNFASEYSDGKNETESTVIGYLLECMTKRADWMAEELGCDYEPRTRVIAADKPITPPNYPNNPPDDPNNPSDDPNKNPPNTPDNPSDDPTPGKTSIFEFLKLFFLKILQFILSLFVK